jgi:GNAT superfamily N-acetyltransferase
MDRADITIRTNPSAVDLQAIVRLHQEVYGAEYGFDDSFAAHVEEPVAQLLTAGDPRERLWIAEEGGRLVGCIAVVEDDAETARIRWFLVAPEARNVGLGSDLLEQAVDFCRGHFYRRVSLWTVSLLTGVARLYRTAGSTKREEAAGDTWGADTVHERYELAH